MRLFCLHEGLGESINSRLTAIENACRTESIAFKSLDSQRIDYSNLPTLGADDLLYNCGRGSETLETLLLNDEVTTFYLSRPQIVGTPVDTVDWAILHHRAALSAPKTVFHMTDDRALLRKYVDFLGGFTVVLKARAGTRGIGTIRSDSWPSLLSTVDFLLS